MYYIKCYPQYLLPLKGAPDPPGKLHVSGHDGHSLGVDGAEVGVLKQAGKE